MSTRRLEGLLSGVVILSTFLDTTLNMCMAQEEFPTAVWLRDFPGPSAPFPVDVLRTEGGLDVSSPAYGPLIIPDSLPLYLPSNCTVDCRVKPAEMGFEIIYQITNPTQEPQALPTLQLASQMLGPVVDFMDHRFGCEWIPLDASSGDAVWSPCDYYPRSLYAPVIVARNSQVAVGVSLIHDVFAHGHEIRTYLGRAADGTQYGDAWNMKFYLDGTIPARTIWQYAVVVRYAWPEDWIYTLAPYKAFLHHFYGDVQYRQNRQPVWATSIGDSLRVSPDNPRGFRDTRPDLNGWQADVDYILDWAPTAGYKRVLVWTPAGVYDENPQNNFPPQIMHEWLTPMIDSELEWRRIRAQNIALLFWWGRSGAYADQWNDPTLETFDYDNDVQFDSMLDQWRLAVYRGASGLGLDKFTQMWCGDQVRWLKAMWSVKPNALFVAEPAAYDILHLQVPTFLYADDLDAGPHLLADYLAPGREMWVILHDDDTLDHARYLQNECGMTIVYRGRDFTAHDLLR